MASIQLTFLFASMIVWQVYEPSALTWINRVPTARCSSRADLGSHAGLRFSWRSVSNGRQGAKLGAFLSSNLHGQLGSFGHDTSSIRA
jgi:hypothetical protein